MDMASWMDSCISLGSVSVHNGAGDRIESAGSGCLEVDFANVAIGGGVLGGGRAQEEIRFLICPELSACIVLCEAMLPTEAIEVCGIERYSQYSGYSRSFQFAGNFIDESDGARLVAMDAAAWPMDFQYSEHGLQRELNKARAGFLQSEADADVAMAPVATGNWGCGVFGGDAQLKSLIQWAAASMTGRSIRYYPFTHPIANELPLVVSKVRACGLCTVGSLCRALYQYHGQHRIAKHFKLMVEGLDYSDAGIGDVERHESVFEFVLRSYGSTSLQQSFGKHLNPSACTLL